MGSEIWKYWISIRRWPRGSSRGGPSRRRRLSRSVATAHKRGGQASVFPASDPKEVGHAAAQLRHASRVAYRISLQPRASAHPARERMITD